MDVAGHERALAVPPGHDPESDEAADELRAAPVAVDSSASVNAPSLMGGW